MDFAFYVFFCVVIYHCQCIIKSAHLKECCCTVHVVRTPLGFLGAVSEDVGDAVDDQQPQGQVPWPVQVLGHAVQCLEEVVGAVNGTLHQDVVLADMGRGEVASMAGGGAVNSVFFDKTCIPCRECVCHVPQAAVCVRALCVQVPVGGCLRCSSGGKVPTYNAEPARPPRDGGSCTCSSICMHIWLLPADASPACVVIVDMCNPGSVAYRLAL